MGSKDGQGDANGVSTTRKTFTILETIRDEEGLSVTEVTRRTGLPKSTTFRHVKTLEDLGYLVERDGGYYVGLRFLQISETARTRRVGYTAAKRTVFELGRETDERAVFIVEEDYDAVYVHRYGSLADTMIGARRPLHTMACGKVILAEWDDDAVRTFVDETGLEAVTDNTITDPDDLFAELETVRERGYAINDQEHMDGLRGIAVPVYTPEDDLLGGLGVFGPTSRLKGEYLHEELSTLLHEKAGEIRVTLAYG